MPPLCHFYGMQPSECRALTMRQVRAFARYMHDYRKAEAEANRGQ